MKLLDKFIINVRKTDLNQIGSTNVYQLYINIPELRNYKQLKANITGLTLIKSGSGGHGSEEEFILNSDTFNFINNYSTFNMSSTGVLSTNSNELVSVHNNVSFLDRDSDVYFPIVKNINGLHRFWITNSSRTIIDANKWSFKIVIVGVDDLDEKF
jgi:hypothetical protein